METLDLREEPASARALAAFAALRESGGELRLLTADDPALLLAGVDLHLRNALAWETRRAGGHWETVFRPAAAAPAGIVERLVQEHRGLDARLGQVLRALNGGDVPGALALAAVFAAGLRRHLALEDQVLAPVLGTEGHRPLARMLEEHRALEEQLAALEAASGAEAWEIETYAALLSATLAKHEHREENELFPAWRARLAALPPAEAEALAAKAAG